MKYGPARIAALVVLALLALAAAPGSASAISKKRADRLALQILQPKRQPGAVVVFGHSRRLPASARLSEPVPPGARSALPRRRIGRAAWLYWMDLHYRDGFKHPSRLLLLDARSGKRLMLKRLSFWPRIDGRDAAFVRERAYVTRRGAIFQRLTPAAAFRPRPDAFATAAQAGGLEEDCVVAIGGASAPRTVLNFAKYWKSLGVETYYPRPSARPYTTEADVERAGHEAAQRCKDVILYIEGHGDGGSVLVANAGQAGRPDDLWINAGLIAAIINGSPNTSFKVIVDSCASGIYGNEVRRLATAGNLLITLTSVTGDQSSFAYIGTDLEMKQAFTESLIAGMSGQGEEMLRLDESSAPRGARLIELGFNFRDIGVAEAALGRTPTMNSNLPPMFGSGTPPPPGGGGGPGPAPAGSGRIERICQGCNGLNGYVTFDQPFTSFKVVLPAGWEGAGSEARTAEKGVGQCQVATTNTNRDSIICTITEPQPAGTEVTFGFAGIHNGQFDDYPSGAGADLYHLDPATGPFRMTGP